MHEMSAPDKIVRFQFTPLREGRPGSHFPPIPLNSFQFTPLREGRRSKLRGALAVQDISIHAPA